MTTSPEQPTATDVLDAETARQALTEMAAVVRTIFGVNLHNTAAPAQQHHEPEVYEDIPPAFDLAPEHEITVPQTAALTSVPAPTTVPVPVMAATVTAPGLATAVVTSPDIGDAKQQARQTADLPAAPAADPPAAVSIPVAGIPLAGIPVPGIAVPGLTVPSVIEIADEQPQTQLPDAQQSVDQPTGDADEDPQDEPSLPPAYAATPDRHSMALLHEIAFLDD